MVKTDIKVVKGIRFEVDPDSISPNMIYYNNSSDNFRFTDGVGNSSPIPAHTHASSKEGGQVQLTALEGYEKIFKGICTNAHFQCITETAFDNNELVCTDLFNASGGKMSTVTSTNNASWVTDHYQITSIDNSGTISGSNMNGPYSNAFDNNDATWSSREFDTTSAGAQYGDCNRIFPGLKYVETVDIKAYSQCRTTFSSLLKEGHVKLYTHNGTSWTLVDTLCSFSETTTQEVICEYDDVYTLPNPYIYGIKVEVYVLSTNEATDKYTIYSADFDTQVCVGVVNLTSPLNSRGLGKFLYNYTAATIPTNTTIDLNIKCGLETIVGAPINTIIPLEDTRGSNYQIAYILKATSSSNNPHLYGYSFLQIKEDLTFDNKRVPVYLDFNETSGTVAKDISGNGNDGIYIDTTLGNAGVINSCALLADNGGSVELSPKTLKYVDDFTMSIWVKMTSPAIGAFNTIYSCSGSLYGNNTFLLIQYDGNHATEPNTFHLFRNGVDNTFAINTLNIHDGNWHNIIITRSGASYTLYADGVVDSIVLSLDSDSICVDTFVIGQELDSNWGNIDPNQSLDGSTDEFFILSETITSTDATWIYNSGNGRTSTEVLERWS